MSGSEYYFGIDLGTTNSSISLCLDGQVRVLPNMDGDQITPSVVHVDELGVIRIGRQAYESWAVDPANTQAEFKRWMGFSDELAFPASGRSISAEELSAEVLKSLLADAQRHTGVRPESSVVTVPAAFGQLQCEATTRAAARAGLKIAPLLQEPIATAIAYGADPTAGDQRWMVFDLGGGTLDIAIVSTRNGRLAVLEHCGDNRLGGKDMDRAIASDIFIPALAGGFTLPDQQKQPAAFNQLFRRLVRHAEIAKKVLSTTDSANISLLDLGVDKQGRPMQMSLTVTRSQMTAAIQPLLDRCLSLAQLALTKARMTASGLTSVIGVGGPARMPCIREMLESSMGIAMRCDLDPMTVVSQGAARFAAASNCLGATGLSETDQPATSESASIKVPISISHERSSATALSPVGGTVPLSAGIATIRLKRRGGKVEWNSGLIPIVSGQFSTTLKLDEKAAVTRFVIEAFGKQGQAIPVDPSGFSVALAMPLAAAPLPHTIAVELTDVHGNTVYEPIFQRDSALPAEVTRSYRAEASLRPSEPEGRLPIKFWEIDVSEDTSERWWCGCVEISATNLSRPVSEGAEIQLKIRIDASRKIHVNAHIPSIHQTFAEDVYLPDPPSASSHLQTQLDSCFDRLRSAWQRIYSSGKDDLKPTLTRIQEELDEMALQTGSVIGASRRIDPDVLLRQAGLLRGIRIKLTHVEEQLVSEIDHVLLVRIQGIMRFTEQICHDHGDADEQKQCADLRRRFNGYKSTGDSRGVRWIEIELRQLQNPILERMPEYWTEWLEALNSPGRFNFISRREADQWLGKANAAEKAGEQTEMRRCIRALWSLLPDRDQAARNRDSQTGLRGG